MGPGLKGRQTAPHEVVECMVFRPTMEEFHDFEKYMEFMESKGAHIAGIAKIIPPDEWQPRKSGYSLDSLKDIVIERPIKQTFTQIGDRKCYQTKSSSRSKLTVKEYFNLTETSTYKTPQHHDYDDLERKYWKSLGFVPPIYGADVADSITDDDVVGWNVGKLKSILNYVGQDQNESYAGVTTPYLYFGSWKTTFSWHVEDMDLYAINFLHFGMPKTWYCVPPQYGHILESAARKLFPDVASWCSNFMRHKTCLIHPALMDELGVPYQKVVQEERNIIIVYPYAYHSGFNHGFNCAESTNFALPRWVEYGKRHKPCDCTKNIVRMNMDCFVKRFQPDRYDAWITGKDIAPHPEDPPEVVEEILLQAKDPEAYKKLMKERFLKDQEDKGEKITFVTSSGKHYSVYKHNLVFTKSGVTLNDEENQEFQSWKDIQLNNSNIVFTEAGGPFVSKDRRLVHIYQHVYLQQIRVKVLPRTLTVIGDGMQLLKEHLPNERFQTVQDLINKGALIKIGERQMKRKNKVEENQEKDGQPLSKKIKLTKKKMKEEINVEIYKHITKDLIAMIDPKTMQVADPHSQPELMDFLGGQSFKAMLNVFNFTGENKIHVVEKLVEIDPDADENLWAPRDPYNIYRDMETNKYIVINPETSIQPDISPLNKPELIDDETLQDQIDKERLKFLFKRKFKRGIKYNQITINLHHYKHRENSDISINIIPETMKLYLKGRRSNQLAECLEGKTVKEVIENKEFIFVGEKSIVDFYQDKNSHDRNHTKNKSAVKPLPEQSDSTANTITNDLKKCDSFLPATTRDEDINENLYLSTFKVNSDGVKKVDVAILKNRKTLYRFKYNDDENENKMNEDLFNHNDIISLWERGVLEKDDSRTIIDHHRLYDIAIIDSSPVIRYKFDIKGWNETITLDKDYNPINVKKLGPGAQDLLSDNKTISLIQQGIFINQEIIEGFSGGAAYKKAVLGQPNLKKVDPSITESVQIYNLSGTVTIKFLKNKEFFIIKMGDSNKAYSIENGRVFKQFGSKFDENEIPSTSGNYQVVDEEDYDDIEDSEVDELVDENSESESENSDSDYDDDEYRRRKQIRKERKNILKARKAKRDRGKSYFKSYKNYGAILDVTTQLIERFNHEKASDEIIKYSKLNIIEKYTKDHGTNTLVKILEVFGALGMLIEVSDNEKRENDTIYEWHGDETNMDTLLLDLMHGRVKAKDELSKHVQEMIKYLMQNQNTHKCSMNELVVKTTGRPTADEIANQDIYAYAAILQGIGLLKREGFNISFIGNNKIFKKYIQDLESNFSKEFDLKCLKVHAKKIKITEEMWKVYYSYLIDRRLRNKPVILERPASEEQRKLARETGVCQCGVKTDCDFEKKKSVIIGQRRKKRCFKCTGCLAQSCKECDFCMKPHMKKPCRKRICLDPQLPKCPCFV